jgi:hypothetical protein
LSGSEYGPPSGSAFVRVAAVMPFFRYAVGPTSQHSPAIPYFAFKGAKQCLAEVVRELPWCGAIMYKRTWRGLVTVCEYTAADMVGPGPWDKYTANAEHHARPEANASVQN